MEKKKWIAIAVAIVLVLAAVAFVEFSGIRQDIQNKIEEKKMWISAGEELVEHINDDAFFTNKYSEIESWKITERKSITDEEGGATLILTISCETESVHLQIYASKYNNENWRYRVESVTLK